MKKSILGLYYFHIIKWHPANTYGSILHWSTIRAKSNRDTTHEMKEFHAKHGYIYLGII